MHKNIMKKWVNALRSGKYRKGRNRLCSIRKNGNKNWCCLGVLCDLYIAENPGALEPTIQFDGWTRKDVVAYDDGFSLSTMTTLPNKVAQWAGIAFKNGQFINQRTFQNTCLAELNDCTKSKRSFKRIADIIEKNWSIL
jgi:hypothetical protein